MSEKTSTFLVTAVDEESAVLRDVHDAQVHTIEESQTLSEEEVVEATITPVPPMEVVWRIDELADRRTIELVDSDLEPTAQAREIAANQEPGDIDRVERAGTGELHVLSTPEGEAEATAATILADEETLTRAARLDAVRVEVRTGDGLVSVRYLPD
jgi:hypothetical protein